MGLLLGSVLEAGRSEHSLAGIRLMFEAGGWTMNSSDIRRTCGQMPKKGQSVPQSDQNSTLNDKHTLRDPVELALLGKVSRND